MPADRYRLERVLGRGGMGEVCMGRDETVLRRRVAVKCCTGCLPTRRRPRRFQKEAAILASLRHPGITVVRDAGDHDEYLFLVRELPHGRDLAQLTARHAQGPLLDTVPRPVPAGGRKRAGRYSPRSRTGTSSPGTPAHRRPALLPDSPEDPVESLAFSPYGGVLAAAASISWTSARADCAGLAAGSPARTERAARNLVRRGVGGLQQTLCPDQWWKRPCGVPVGSGGR